MAKRNSSSRGRQMPSHYSYRELNIWSVPTPTGAQLLPACGMAWGMHPAMIAKPRIAEGLLVELTPDTPLNVTLYWTVTRLHASALRTFTDAVRSTAKARLFQA